MNNIVGADLALVHGAIVDLDGNVLYAYDSRKGMLSTTSDLYKTAEDCARHTPRDCTVVVDWDRGLGNWGATADVGTLITMLISFYGALCIGLGCDVHYVTPGLVRHCLGLGKTCHKSEVHAAMLGIMPVFEDDAKGDKADAFILCHTFACSKQRNVF